MANIGTPRTGAELFMDGLLSGDMPTTLRYSARVEIDASAAAVEIPLNGETDSRLYLPTLSVICFDFKFTAWNITDGDDDASIYTGYAAFQRESGGAVEDIDLDTGTAGTQNPIETLDIAPGSEVWDIAPHASLPAVVVNFTGEASKNYLVTGTIDYSFVGANSRFSNHKLLST